MLYSQKYTFSDRVKGCTVGERRNNFSTVKLFFLHQSSFQNSCNIFFRSEYDLASLGDPPKPVLEISIKVCVRSHSLRVRTSTFDLWTTPFLFQGSLDDRREFYFTQTSQEKLTVKDLLQNLLLGIGSPCNKRHDHNFNLDPYPPRNGRTTFSSYSEGNGGVNNCLNFK